MAGFVDITGGLPTGTQQKINILGRTRGPIASGVNRMFAQGGPPPNFLDKYTRNLLQTLFSQEIAIGQSIVRSTSTFGQTLDNISGDFNYNILRVSAGFEDALKPVSTALGSTLGTLTGILRDPLGSLTLLPQTLSRMVEKISPKFAATIEGTFKSTKLEGLVHLPGQILGSIRNLLTMADAILTLPIIILSDLYNGLIGIMEEIASFVDEIISSIMDAIFNKIFGLLNRIIPIDAVLEFLDAVIELAAEIQGLSTIFLGPNIVAGYALNIQNLASSITNFIQNPTQLIYSFIPQQFSQNLNQAFYYLRNPEQLINSILPASFTGMIDRVLTPVTGLSFNGNMGYGFGAVLNGLRGGVVSTILRGFANQYPILTPLLGFVQPTSSRVYMPTALRNSLINSNIPVVQGIPQIQAPPGTVLPQTPCWIAREVYGLNNIRWILFRDWLFKNSGPVWLQNLYLRYGQQFARWISNKPCIKFIVRKLMDLAIYKQHEAISW